MNVRICGYSNGRFVRWAWWLPAVMVVFAAMGAGDCLADTFKHRESGEVFHGFATQKVIRNQTRVYVAEEEKFKPVYLKDYDVTVNGQGRRDNVIVIPLYLPEVLISRYVSDTVSKTIRDASNKGPKFILIEIDLPGGRGDYMRDICATITAASNCPVIGYVTGGKFGGAHSAAAVVALACDKLYISPGGAMGSGAPIIAAGMDERAIEQYRQMYSSKSLAVYRSFADSLAGRNGRPSVLAMALLDTEIEVIEVADSSGKKFFIDRSEKVPTQVLVKTWTKSKVKEVSGGGYGLGDSVIRENELTLSAKEAVYSKMADGIAASRGEIFALMQAGDARMTRSAGVDKAVAKFLQNRRQVEKLFASVTYLEERADLLDKELQAVHQQQNLVTETRTQRSISGDRANPRLRGPDRRNRARHTEQVTIDFPAANEERLVGELSFVLSDLMREYRKLLGLARRYPGALPLGVTVGNLEKRAYAGQVKFDNLSRLRRSRQAYP